MYIYLHLTSFEVRIHEIHVMLILNDFDYFFKIIDIELPYE